MAARTARGARSFAGTRYPILSCYLSAGQRRRLALARLAAAPAALWLLDEPTVTLDDAAVGLVESLIARHRAGGGAVVVATHAALAIPGAATLELGDAP